MVDNSSSMNTSAYHLKKIEEHLRVLNQTMKMIQGALNNLVAKR